MSNNKQIHLFYQKNKMSFFFIMIIFFISYCYTDIVITTRHGINLWNSVFNNDIFNFYNLNHNATLNSSYFPWLPGEYPAIYDFPIYIIFALWDLPLWIAEKYFNIDVLDSTICLIWAKMIILPFLFACLKIIYKICQEIGIDKNNSIKCLFIFLTSNIYLASIIIMSQYDIIGLFFVLLGVYYYLKNNNKLFIFWFSIAITFKYFALLIFIPLLLLSEKSVLRIMYSFSCSFIPLIIMKLPFLLKEQHFITNNIGINMIFNFPLAYKFPAVYGAVVPYIILLVLLCLFCYLKITQSIEEKYQYTIYISFLSMAIFFAFSNTHPYWIILMLPYLCIISITNKALTGVNLLLETLISTSIVVAQMIKYWWCYSIRLIGPMFISKIYGSINIDYAELNPLTLLATKTQTILFFDEIASSIFMASLICFSIINYPKFNKNTLVKINYFTLLNIRLALGFLLCISPILMYIYFSKIQ